MNAWPAAIFASLAAHLVVLLLTTRTLRTADSIDRGPPIAHQMLRGGSPIPVALFTDRGLGERAGAGEPAPQAIRRIGRGRGRAHATTPGPAPALPDSANGREATTLPATEEASGESRVGEQGNPTGGSGEIPSGQSGSGGQSPSRGGAMTPERIAELHQRLASSAQRCYPPAARRLRLHGQVGLHFCLGEDGLAESRSLRGSTGSALLDRASLDCVLAGALPVPAMVGCYDVQVRFSDER